MKRTALPALILPTLILTVALSACSMEGTVVPVTPAPGPTTPVPVTPSPTPNPTPTPTPPTPTPTPTPTPPTPNDGPALTLASDRLPVVTGSEARLAVTLDRAGRPGPVTLALSGLPSGASAPTVTVPDGSTTAEIVVSAAATAPHSLPTAVTLRAASNGRATERTITVTVRGPAGSVDTTFGANGIAVAPIGVGEDVPHALALQPDGKLIVAGRADTATGADFAVARFTRDGALDATFGTNGKVLIDFAGKADTARAVAVQPDGKIVVAGGATTGANEERFGVARLTPSGAPDTGFGGGGKAFVAFAGSTGDRANALVLQPDGMIVLGGSATFASNASGVDFALARLTASGTPDGAFGTAGRVTTPMTTGSASDVVRALALQSDGKIVAAGGDGDFRAARYTATGALDAGFGANGKAAPVFAGSIGGANAVRIDAEGRIVLAGHSDNDTAAARLTAAGTLDPGFGTGGKVRARLSDNWDAATALALQSDGKLVLGGWVYEGNSSSGNFAVTRLDANGARDAAFGTGGTTVTPVAPGGKPDEANAALLQPDDRIPAARVVLAGSRNDSNQDFALVRYWP